MPKKNKCHYSKKNRQTAAPYLQTFFLYFCIYFFQVLHLSLPTSSLPRRRWWLHCVGGLFRSQPLIPISPVWVGVTSRGVVWFRTQPKSREGSEEKRTIQATLLIFHSTVLNWVNDALGGKFTGGRSRIMMKRCIRSRQKKKKKRKENGEQELWVGSETELLWRLEIHSSLKGYYAEKASTPSMYIRRLPLRRQQPITFCITIFSLLVLPVSFNLLYYSSSLGFTSTRHTDD